MPGDVQVPPESHERLRAVRLLPKPLQRAQQVSAVPPAQPLQQTDSPRADERADTSADKPTEFDSNSSDDEGTQISRAVDEACGGPMYWQWQRVHAEEFEGESAEEWQMVQAVAYEALRPEEDWPECRPQ